MQRVAILLVTVAGEEEEDGEEGKEIHDSTHTIKGQISKRGARRSSGRCSLPECVHGGGCRRQVGSVGDVAGGGGAGGDGGCST